MPHEIFISHTQRDKQLADALKDAFSALFGERVKTLYSTAKELDSGIGHGEKWFEWIVERVLQCDVALVLITPNSVRKPWIPWEAGAVYGAAMAATERKADKVRPVIFSLGVEHIPSPIREAQTQFLYGDKKDDVTLLFTSLADTFQGLPTQTVIDFGKNLDSVVEQYLEHVELALQKAPMLPSSVVIEEWRLRLDEVLASKRMSEVDQFHDWMDIAFGRETEDTPQPIDLRIHSKLAEIYARSGNRERAVEQYELALALSPRDIYILRNLGKVYLDAGSPDKARELLDRIDDLDPEAKFRNAEIAALLGRWLRNRKEFAKAAEVYAAALECDDNSYYLANLLAEARMQANDMAGARAAFEQALKIIAGLPSEEKNEWVLATATNAAFFTDNDEQAAELVAEIAAMQPGQDKIASIAGGLRRIAENVDDGDQRVQPLLAELGV